MSEEKSFNMAKEFADADFKDARQGKRFVKTMETLSKRPGNSIRASAENRAKYFSLS
jgi:hypothetical protein